MMRISLSGWMRRLWTLQEGVLASRLHVKLKYSILEVASAERALNNPSGNSGLSREIKSTYGTVPNSAAQFYIYMRSIRSMVVDTYEPRLIGIRKVRTCDDEAGVKETREGFAVVEEFVATCHYRTTGT
ncbi:uncharacterized protein F4817DRAFT_341573 [Daldinia loculata]|uniref:uncharacterized protein n=1 Tax=Daldinia loculata TaxID=103429 RepID=UPI0020C4D916|nr:uncharacterized protein F4817DRAFT_341573 [Daldinia loculata]KAI1646011.1 hypothetical protein F4817DRAFT_341573 [Daldinia loculata]